ncbi:hypothetical protein BDR22DRAFT_854479 [Usnea florida]
MSSHCDQSIPSANLQTPRASRISEADWNARRQKLEKLYLDDDLSRQEIMETMAKKDNFVVSEKQLKYQFKKWGLKKYVSDQDLTKMLSLKRKRQEQGKDTKFEYRGHIFEQERLERASKRRKGPLISSPVLPPYIVALVSPLPSPQLGGIRSGLSQTSAPPQEVAEVVTNVGGATVPGSPFNDSSLQPSDFCLSELAGSLDSFSYSALVSESWKNQSNNDWWSTLLDDSRVNLSPWRGPAMLSPPRQDSNNTRTEPRRQLSNSTPDCSAAQDGNNNEVDFLNMDLDSDFALFESSPHRSSSARSASFHAEQITHTSGEMTSVSPLQLHDNSTPRNGSNTSRIPRSSSLGGRVVSPVTARDLRAESIASLLMMLKSYLLPSFDIASQKYEYGNSIITRVFCPNCCEWLCSEYEALLDVHLERTLMSNRKRRMARTAGFLTLGSNVDVDETEQDLELTAGVKQSSNSDEGVMDKLRGIFFHRSCTPIGIVEFEVKEKSCGPVTDVESHPNTQIIIKFLPQAKERTLGLGVRFNRLINKPGISPHIDTFNIIPYDSAIFGCVHSNDLKGVQSLFDQGAASARDVDPEGRSLLNYAIVTGCFDLFRLLLQGGASFYALDVYNTRTTDIITTIWELAIMGVLCRICSSETVYPSTGRVVKFDERVAMTQLALDNDCSIYDANKKIELSSPLFSMMDYESIDDLDPSHMRDVIQYLTSIGYDLEESNKCGQTPLLLAASDVRPATTIFMEFFIERGARLDTKDGFGLGLLHAVLLSYLYLMDLGNDIHPDDKSKALKTAYGDRLLNWNPWVPDVRDIYWELSSLLGQNHAEDCRPLESVSHHFSSARSISVCDSTPSNPDSGLDVERSGRLGLQASQVAAARSLSEVTSFLESTSDAALGSEESILEANDVEGYVICKDDDGEERWIRNPVPILKARTAIKLKILLEAGCDPNMLDDDGLSPSDYAKRGIWIRDAWFWVLRETGHTFDALGNRWIKRSTPT